MDAKHQFKYSYQGGCEDFSPVDITFEVPGDASLSQMLYNFQSYLKACGFVFDGELEIVDRAFDVMKDQDDIDEVYGCMADSDNEDTHVSLDNLFKKSCGCPVGEKGIKGEKGVKDSKWTKAEKMIKEWNEGIAKLDNEQLQKAMKTAHEMSGLHYEATKEVVKNNWVHGMCNPPSPDWKKKK